MKRLLDESTDELTRSLLQAGVEHHPPSGNERQVIMALGAGGALGLFSSNAFAWLGTTAGKVTAAGVAVGVAGAVLVGAPLLRSSGFEGSGERGLGEKVVTERILAQKAVDVEASQEPARSAGSQLEAPSPARASEPEQQGEPEPALVAGGEPSRARGLSEERRSRKASGTRRSKQTSGKKARHGAGAAKKAEPQAARAEAPATTAPDAKRAALDAEVRLVDEMHAAARRDDREALERLVAAYQREFPDGQLQKEVTDFEALLSGAEAP